MSQLSPTLGEPSSIGAQGEEGVDQIAPMPAPKKSRTNTPWSPVEEQRLKVMRDAGNSWGEIAKVRPFNKWTLPKNGALNFLKTFPNRTEGSVKKHWYKVRS